MRSGSGGAFRAPFGFPKDERGQVLIAASFVVTVGLLFLALVCDAGMLHVMRARLQTAADAGTLAAVQENAHVRVKKDLVPVYSTEFFGAGEDLPPEEYISSKEPVTEKRPVYRRIDGRRVRVGYEDVLVGYNVTYVAGWEERVTDVALDLWEPECRPTAQQVMSMNLAASPEGFGSVGPFIVEDSAEPGSFRASYRIDEAALLLESLFFPGDWRAVSVKSEATAAVSPGR